MIDGELELILIIGGNGYIGSRLYQELIQSLSEPVRVYDKQCTSPLLKGAQWMQGDLKDPISIEQALHEADTVIYLAGGHYATFRQNQESMLGDLGRFLAVVACNPVKRQEQLARNLEKRCLGSIPIRPWRQRQRIWCGSVLRPWEALMPS